LGFLILNDEETTRTFIDDGSPWPWMRPARTTDKWIGRRSRRWTNTGGIANFSRDKDTEYFRAGCCKLWGQGRPRRHLEKDVGVEELRRILSNGFENITRLAPATSENYIGVISLQPPLAGPCLRSFWIGIRVNVRGSQTLSKGKLLTRRGFPGWLYNGTFEERLSSRVVWQIRFQCSEIVFHHDKSDCPGRCAPGDGGFWNRHPHGEFIPHEESVTVRHSSIRRGGYPIQLECWISLFLELSLTKLPNNTEVARIALVKTTGREVPNSLRKTRVVVVPRVQSGKELNNEKK